MKLAIERNILLSALSQVMGAVAVKSNLPILSCVYVKGDGDVIYLTGTDLEMTLRSTIRGVHHEAFESVWPAKRLFDILKAYPENGIVGISVEDEKFTVKCGRSRFVLTTHNVIDFPLISEKMGFDVSFSIDRAELKKQLQRVDFAMADQDVRYYLNGLLFNGVNNEIRFVATDGHRLAKESTILTEAFAEQWQAILPRDAVGELRRIGSLGDGPIEIAVRANLIRFSTEDLMFIAKRLDGRFPDYERVIPKESNKFVIVERESLLNALQRVRLVLDKNNNGIRLTIDDQSLLIEGIAIDDQAEDELDVQHEGENLVIGLNADYLIAVVKALNDDSVKIEFQDVGSSIKIVEKTGIYVIMPMRL